MKAYVYSNDLWEDIDLQDSPLHQAPVACRCQNPFCENHRTEDEDFAQEWASMEQQAPSRPGKHAITSAPTNHAQKRQRLTVLDDKSPTTFTICGAPQNSTLLRNRQRQKLTVLEDPFPKTVTICAAPLWDHSCIV